VVVSSDPLAPGPSDVLVGRAREQALISQLISEARAGCSRVLAVVGAPGVGKSALLGYAERHAGGMRALPARGVESEAAIPFAGLSELLRPLLGHVRDIPSPQAVAIESALALRPARRADRFAVGAATLSLLAAGAEDQPLLVLVDDAQWLDGSSAAALLFALRRLEADRVGALIGLREGPSTLLDSGNISVLSLEGLDLEAAGELLAIRTGRPLPPAVVERLHRHAGGNPLALLEFASSLDQFGLEVNEVPIDLPLPVVTRVGRVYVDRIRNLPAPARAMLLLAAANDTDEWLPVDRAARALGLVPTEIAAAEAERLVNVSEGRVEFRHPLVRSAVYGDAGPADRRTCHRALAAALPNTEADRRAWHLALGSLGPDDSACAALEQAALRSRERSAYDVASRAFERAADLAVEDERRAHLLQLAAESAWSAGLVSRAGELVERARKHERSPETAVALEHLRGHVSSRLGTVRQSQVILAAGAELARRVDNERAIVMLAEIVNAAFYAGDPAAMQAAAERISTLAPEGPSLGCTFYAPVALGMALLFTGNETGGAALLRSAGNLALSVEDFSEDPRLLVWAAMCPIWLRESGALRALIDRAVEVARGRAAIGLLPYLLSHVAIDQATTDRPAEAIASFHEVLELARETGQRTDLSAALARLACLEARMGLEAECRAHAHEALDLAGELGLGLCEIWATAALGELDLALGRPACALAAFERQSSLLDAHGIGDADLSPGPELVELYLRAGRRAVALRVASEYEQRAARKGQAWALARASRARAMTSSEETMEEHFERALERHEQTPDLFETARTCLAYGARLRRSRKRARAREQLRRAIDIFDGLRAEPWAAASRAELAATGETVRRRNPSTQDKLTPQELQIALVLAGGRTTRDAAGALFLSPKTVEYHLRSVYRKFGINSREELAAVMGQSVVGRA
jgi:DNA-binding CsgD family transcriptional regulator